MHTEGLHVIKRPKQIAPLHGLGPFIQEVMATVVNCEINRRRECRAEIFKNFSHFGYLKRERPGDSAQVEVIHPGPLSGKNPRSGPGPTEQELGTAEAKDICFADKLQEE